MNKLKITDAPWKQYINSAGTHIVDIGENGWTLDCNSICKEYLSITIKCHDKETEEATRRLVAMAPKLYAEIEENVKRLEAKVDALVKASRGSTGGVYSEALKVEIKRKKDLLSEARGEK